MLPRYLDCPRAAASGQFSDIVTDSGIVLNERRTGIYTAVGNGTHEAGRFMVSDKITTGSLPPVNECIDFGVSEFKDSLKEYDEIAYDDITPNYNIGIHQIGVLTKAYYYDVAPKLLFPEGADPKDHLELHIKTRIGDDAELSGHIDTLTSASVVDTKSGKTLRPAHTQCGGYGNLLISNGGKKPENFVVVHLPRVHKEKAYPGTKFVFYPVDFCLNESWYVVKQIIRDVRNFKQSGNPACFPANPHSTLCGPKYCRCYGTKFCEYF